MLSILLWVPGYFKEASIVFNYKDPLLSAMGYLMGTGGVNVFFTSVLIGGQAIFLNYLINDHKLFKSTHFVVAFFYVLLNGACYDLFSFNPVVFANTFILLGLHQLFRLYNLTSSLSVIFNAGLFFGIGALLYPPLVLVFPLVWVSLSYLRSPKANDYLVAIIGFIVPFVYWGVYLFLTDNLADFNEDVIFQHHIINSPFIAGSNLYFFACLGVVFLLALFSGIGFLNRSIVKIRKLFVLLLLFLILCLPTVLFNYYDFAALYLLLIPGASVVIANFMVTLKKGWQAELLVLLLVAAMILHYFL